MSPSSNTLLLMSYNSELVRLYRALFHTSAFLKEVLAFQMQDILFLESNSTISLACKISVCFFFSLWSSSHMQISLHCMALWWPTTDPTSTNNTFKEQLKEPPPTPPPPWLLTTSETLFPQCVHVLWTRFTAAFTDELQFLTVSEATVVRIALKVNSLTVLQEK